VTRLTNEAGATRLRPVRDPQLGTKSRAHLLVGALVVAFVAGGCTSTKVPGEIRNEPVCPDFELGAAKVKMKGSLRKPVQVSIVEDDDVLWERVLLGRRSPDDPAFPFVVPDDDATYQVRWAQCPNTFAPKKVELDVRVQDLRLDYTCGEAEVYQTVELAIREGDAASRIIEWVAPPEPACWGAEEEAEGGDEDAADEGDDAPPEPSASAAPSPSDAPSASAAPSSSAAPSAAAPTPAPSAPPPPPAPTPAGSATPTGG